MTIRHAVPELPGCLDAAADFVDRRWQIVRVDCKGYATQEARFDRPGQPLGDTRCIRGGSLELQKEAHEALLMSAPTRLATRSWPSSSCRAATASPTLGGRSPPGGTTWSAASGFTPAGHLEPLEVRDIDELIGVGSVVTEKYFLDVCLGDRIPSETAAARVKTSRVDTGPDWRAYLQKAIDGELSAGISLEELLQCPCCLGILRRPVGLPCGHSLCRGCLIRLSVSPRPCRTGGVCCPMCRAAIPRLPLSVNEALDSVSEALQAFSKLRQQRAHQT